MYPATIKRQYGGIVTADGQFKLQEPVVLMEQLISVLKKKLQRGRRISSMVPPSLFYFAAPNNIDLSFGLFEDVNSRLPSPRLH